MNNGYNINNSNDNVNTNNYNVAPNNNTNVNMNGSNNNNNNVNNNNSNISFSSNYSNNSVYYYGNDKYLDKYSKSKATPTKKRFHFDIFAVIIFVASIYGFVQNLKFDFLAMGISAFCFLWSVLGFKNRNVFYYLALIISFASLVMTGLFYFGILENDSKVLLRVKEDSFVTKVQDAATKVEEDYRILSYSQPKCYNFDTINSLYTFKIKRSPFGAEYSKNSYILIDGDLDNPGTIICFTDMKGNGFNKVHNKNLTRDNLRVGTAGECSLPANCR